MSFILGLTPFPFCLRSHYVVNLGFFLSVTSNCKAGILSLGVILVRLKFIYVFLIWEKRTLVLAFPIQTIKEWSIVDAV